MPETRSFLQITDLTASQIQTVFASAREFKQQQKNRENAISVVTSSQSPLQVVALVFFESSTRTRMSFEMATLRTGRRAILFDGAMGTSLEKGESYSDTLHNIAAMGPDLIVLRAPETLDMSAVLRKMPVPVINAGWGKIEHPTQALLDAFTLLEKRGWTHFQKQERMLFVGDVRHSRVVGSHVKLSQLLDYEIGFCGPEEFMPEGYKQGTSKYFKNLDEALGWATSVVLLRVQKERHSGEMNLEKYIANYSMTSERARHLKKNQWLLHPGPVNYGVEMNEECYSHSSSLILEQVAHGVALRAGVLNYFLEKKS